MTWYRRPYAGPHADDGIRLDVLPDGTVMPPATALVRVVVFLLYLPLLAALMLPVLKCVFLLLNANLVGLYGLTYGAVLKNSSGRMFLELPHMICIRWHRILVMVVAIAGATANSAYAQVRGRCVPSPPCYCSEECLRCGPGGCRAPGGTTGGGQAAPTPDYETERRAQEEAQRKREEDERVEAARRKAEQDRKFIEERDKSAGLLKGNTGAGAFGLKGVDQADAGLRQADRQVTRDLGGKLAAWKQLHCASSIIGSALTALQGDDGQEFSYLAGEANKALNGERLGVACATAPPLPDSNGRKVDLGKVRNAEQKILERAKKIAERLPPKPAALPEQKASPPPTGEDELAKLRRQQAEINRVQQRKYDPASQEAINREQRAKKELTQLILENKKIETGDFSINLAEEVAAGETQSVSGNAKKAVP